MFGNSGSKPCRASSHGCLLRATELRGDPRGFSVGAFGRTLFGRPGSAGNQSGHLSIISTESQKIWVRSDLQAHPIPTPQAGTPSIDWAEGKQEAFLLFP